jgi:transcription initiation factor IIE alpha subunit
MTIGSHEHGDHTCYCPSCGYEETVGENVKCNTLTCPQCGDRMRAKETGEYRSGITRRTE